MAACGKCGQMNMAESHFCRFCGARMPAPQAVAEPFTHAAPPRPYSWKTDEFQTKPEARRTQGGIPQMGTVGPPAYQQPANLSQPYRCPHCLSQFLPRVEKRISTAGWITFAVLLVFFFPLFWIGLLIKEDVRICPTCTRRVN
jgi:RNA polymerase subunit RPABC4/transcription elongation factor Spt4